MGIFDAFTNAGDPSQGGLMGMFANPQSAGLLGMAGGLLQAAGPSRVPVTMGQALSSGLQGMGQGASNAMQMRMEMAKLQTQLDPFGTGFGGMSQQGTPNPTMAQGSPVAGPANIGPLSGVSAGLGGMAPQMPPQSSAPASGIALFNGHTPQEVAVAGARLAAFGNPAGVEMMKIAAQADPSLTPTDITKMGTQAGWTPQQIQQANADAISKNNALSIRPGGGVMIGNKFTMVPAAAPPGFMNQQNPDGSWAVVPIQGGTQAVKDSAAAGSIGKAYGTNTTGYVNGQPTYVNQGQLSDRLTGSAGVPGFTPFQNAIRQVESRGNAAAVNPASGASGSMQTMGSTLTNPGFGVTPARDNSPAEMQRVGADYASAMQAKYGNDTDAAVAYNWGPANADKWIAAGRPWKMLPAETRDYVGQVHAQMQNFSGAPQNAMPTPELPPGATTAANAAQGAPSQQMANSYGALSTADANYQQSREALNEMLGLAHNKGIGGSAVGVLPESVSTRISPDAATYQKAHATYVALQGKALGSGGTDAARATIDEAVPTYDKPQSAMVTGLTNQMNNLDLSHLKTQFLTPIYQRGDEKAYTQQSAAFDQNIKPTMMPILQLSGPQQRAAVQAAIKANPALRPNFEWAFNNGLLR